MRKRRQCSNDSRVRCVKDFRIFSFFLSPASFSGTDARLTVVRYTIVILATTNKVFKLLSVTYTFIEIAAYLSFNWL